MNHQSLYHSVQCTVCISDHSSNYCNCMYLKIGWLIVCVVRNKKYAELLQGHSQSLSTFPVVRISPCPDPATLPLEIIPVPSGHIRTKITSLVNLREVNVFHVSHSVIRIRMALMNNVLTFCFPALKKDIFVPKIICSEVSIILSIL